jgi:hypothetical protein
MTPFKSKTQARLITILFSSLSALWLSACQTPSPDLSSQANAASSVVFIDISRFDNQLKTSLSSSQPEVNVAFYDKVSPNKTPERLEKWLNAIEKTGGKIEIEPPPGEYVAKDPFTLIGLVGSLWNGIKSAMQISQNSIYETTKDHDALISLERNATGEVVISKITFKRKVN